MTTLRTLFLFLAGLAFSAANAATFDFEQLGAMARARAQAPYDGRSAALPAELAAMDYDALRDIRFKPDRALWRDASLPFEAMFFHRGENQRQAVRIHEIVGDTTRKLGYQREDFDFGKNRVAGVWGDLDFAGLRVHYPLNNSQYKDELVVFQGASYFRALGAGQQYGLSARGLAIDTTGGGPEEFPRFTDFWLVRPATGSKMLTVYALLDSPRAAGAYRFDITPGPQTTVQVRMRLFLRAQEGKPIATLGIAPLTSMFLSGENQPRPGDFRPEVHDSDGLLVASGSGEWIWRPLQNPARPVASSFAVDKLAGFGLMQRDRRFASYEDVEARYERRPSAWVRPLGDWGPGRVELFMLNTPDETHDNIVAYWVPRELPAAGQPLELSWEIAWQGDAQQMSPGSSVQQSRRGRGYSRQSDAELAAQVQYVIDFNGPALDALPEGAAVKPVVTADANGRLLEQLAYPNPATKGWRLSFRVQRVDAAKPVELRAFLQQDNHSVSETWSNLLLPE